MGASGKASGDLQLSSVGIYAEGFPAEKGALPGWGTWPWLGRSRRKGDWGRGPGGLACEEPRKLLEG